MVKAVILAAGKGTRMKSDKPKVVHKVLGKPMVYYSIKAAKDAGADQVCAIVGYKADEVKAEVEAIPSVSDISYALQEEQLGTGHAVMCAKEFIGEEGDVIILCGDTPLVTGDTLSKALKVHRESKNGVTVISAVLPDSFGYGRIVRQDGKLDRIVEEKDATASEKEIKEVNSGMYIFDCKALVFALGQIKSDNAQGEYYLPDAIAIIKGMGLSVDAVPMEDVDQIRGVNTLEQLKEAELLMEERK
jgi:bifunctional UDP-N-acetylglucosamine pyrophosphorylase/glucosamine-1-phosphate N-acetyltransferase